MAIIDGLDDQRGIQTFNTQIANASTEGQHWADTLCHTNGNIYVVISQQFSNNAVQRRLFLYCSTDNGNTWSLISSLTTGGIDIYPTILQLDASSTSSDIGIIFVRISAITQSQGIIRRMAVDVNGTETVAPDPITGSPSSAMPVYCVQTISGYKLLVSASRFSNSISVYTNTTFNLNNWVAGTGVNILGASNQGHLLRMRRLANGDLLGVVCYRTGLSGGTSGLNGLPDNLRTDLGVVTSTDDGATFNTVQNLTSYGGTAGVSADGILSALHGDAVQLSDGRIAMLFQEGRSYQTINNVTTPSITTTAGAIGDGFTKTLKHPVHNYLIYGHANGTSGGVFVHDLGSNTITRIHTGSSPAIWENEVMDMAISADGKYLVVATFEDALTDSGSLEIFDTTNPSVASWTVTSLRTSTTPALKAQGIKVCVFDGSSYDVYFTYANVAGSGIFGGKVDASNPVSILDLVAPAAVGTNVIVPGLVVGASQVYSINAARVFATSKSTGVGSYSVVLSSLVANTNQYNIHPVGSNLIVSGSQVYYIVNDTGSTFSTVSGPITSSSNPSIAGNIQRTAQMTQSQNVLFAGGSNEGSQFFCAGTGTFYQSMMIPMDAFFGMNFATSNTMRADEIIINGVGWLSMPDTSQHMRVSTKTGRLRVAIFPYNTATHQLTTSGVNFFDAVNQIRVGDDWDKVHVPTVGRTLADKLIVGAVRLHFNRTSKPKSVVIGVIEPDAQRLQMRARIQNKYTQQISMRCRITNRTTRTVDIRAKIVFAQCILMRAFIVPRVTQTLQMRGSIFGRKDNQIPVIFSVRSPQTNKVRVGFFVPGLAPQQTIQMAARIIKTQQGKIPVRFMVVNSNVGAIQTVATRNLGRTTQTLRMKAGIVRL